MKNNTRVYVALSLAVIIGVGLIYSILRLLAEAQSNEEPSEMMYVDTKSGATFLIASRSSPEANPDTGEQTLVPGMYCSECKAWKPVGPQENRRMRRVTQNCPIHKIPLTSEVPESD